MAVVSEDLTRVLEPGHEELGWLAQTGRVPLGYLGDADKTARTFPAIDGVRYSVPGDRARVRDDGSSSCSAATRSPSTPAARRSSPRRSSRPSLHHPAVYDVRGRRPARRSAGATRSSPSCSSPRASRPSDDDLLASTPTRHVARYKLPKAFVRVDRVHRSPAGKADYRWARQVAAG